MFHQSSGACILRNKEKRKSRDGKKKVARAEAARKEELEKDARVMPVLLGHKEPHRPKYESSSVILISLSKLPKSFSLLYQGYQSD